MDVSGKKLSWHSLAGTQIAPCRNRFPSETQDKQKVADVWQVKQGDVQGLQIC